MRGTESLEWLVDLTTPLASKFGDRLRLHRDADRAHWTYDGHSAIVELRPQGTVLATFIERPASDGASSALAAAVYRSSVSHYGLNPAGCARMVSDMVEFFSGTREPRFTFADVYALT